MDMVKTRNDEDVISSHAQALIAKIPDPKIQQQLKVFWCNDFSQYIQALRLFSEGVKTHKTVHKDRATELNLLNAQIIEKGNRIISLLDSKVLSNQIKKTFRDLGGDLFYRSEMMKKGFKKLRGYPGDYEMMEFVYNRVPVTLDSLGMYFDQYFIDNPYAEAVRGRKNKMVDILRQFFSGSVSKNLRVLNVACGPCREIRELLDSGFKTNTKIHYICTDFEKEALQYSRQKIESKKGNIKFDFIQEDIMNFLRRPALYTKRLGKYDLIYSIGLGDYLTDNIVKKLMNFCWGFLKPGATMVFAHKIEDKDPFAPMGPSWFCDWEFVPRSESHVDKLISSAGLGDFSVLKEWEESGRILFIKITKGQ